jgi:hypothetical protein
MATYSKEQNGPVPRYKLGEEYIKAGDLPKGVKEALKDAPAGTQVDELGEVVDPTTDIDESEDESAPTKEETQSEDESTADEEEVVTPPSVNDTPQSSPGMGFKRVDGKTVSIFSNVPHTAVKNISGIMVPLTDEEYKTKSDGEIIAKLKKLGKL